VIWLLRAKIQKALMIAKGLRFVTSLKFLEDFREMENRDFLIRQFCLITTGTPTIGEKPDKVWLPVWVSKAGVIHEYPLCLGLNNI